MYVFQINTPAYFQWKPKQYGRSDIDISVAWEPVNMCILHCYNRYVSCSPQTADTHLHHLANAKRWTRKWIQP